MVVAMFGATAMQRSFMLGATVIAVGLAGAGTTAILGYVSLYRRWRHIRSHAQALGRLIVAEGGKTDARAEVAWRLVTVAGAHRSMRALPRARAQLEDLHDQLLRGGD